MASGTAVFLDTTIQIARFVHSPSLKQLIEGKIRFFHVSVTSLVVKQEFKRRLLREAKYLLDLLERKQSFKRALRHVTDVLPSQQGRKRNICLEMLLVVFEDSDDADLTERAVMYLNDLLATGLDEFEALVDKVMTDSGCLCARTPIRRVGKRYEFGTDACSRLSSQCGICEFLEGRRDHLTRIQTALDSLPENVKTDELREAHDFIDAFFAAPDKIRRRNPCLTAGDLLIALESIRIPWFYTMNGKESQHLCRALGQSLIVRPINPEREDIVCADTPGAWPSF